MLETEDKMFLVLFLWFSDYDRIKDLKILFPTVSQLCLVCVCVWACMWTCLCLLVLVWSHLNFPEGKTGSCCAPVWQAPSQNRPSCVCCLLPSYGTGKKNPTQMHSHSTVLLLVMNVGDVSIPGVSGWSCAVPTLLSGHVFSSSYHRMTHSLHQISVLTASIF